MYYERVYIGVFVIAGSPLIRTCDRKLTTSSHLNLAHRTGTHLSTRTRWEMDWGKVLFSESQLETAVAFPPLLCTLNKIYSYTMVPNMWTKQGCFQEGIILMIFLMNSVNRVYFGVSSSSFQNTRKPKILVTQNHRLHRQIYCLSPKESKTQRHLIYNY